MSSIVRWSGYADEFAVRGPHAEPRDADICPREGAGVCQNAVMSPAALTSARMSCGSAASGGVPAAQRSTGRRRNCALASAGASRAT